jgi:hypothetical protein
VIRPACLLIILIVPGVIRANDPLAETSVGMSARLEAVVLAGPELEAKPTENRDTPLVLRVIKVYPHGSDFRYDLEFYGLAPGTYNLLDYLKRKDGQPLAANVKPLLVKVVPLLPPGQVKPTELEIQAGPSLGGYRIWKPVAIVVWVLGLIGIVCWMIASRFRSQATAVVDKPMSLADRLRPLVEGAINGKLTHAELASLERSLLAYWRKRLQLETAEPATAIAELRSHPDAGPLLNKLEEWLHRPGPPAEVNLGELLRPYQNLPPEDVDLGVAT